MSKATQLALASMALAAIGSNVIEPIREKPKPTYCPGPNKETRKRRKAVKKARRLNRRK